MTSGFTSSSTLIPEAKHYQPLVELFPAAEGYEVARDNAVSGSIMATSFGGAVEAKHYVEHLFRFESTGMAQLRVAPASPAGEHLVSWLAVGMPGLHALGEQTLLDTLDGEDVNAYLADDPLTNRQNMYVFLDRSVPRADAEELAARLRGIASDRQEGHVEAFPAAASQVRRRVALPFVWGASDTPDLRPAFVWAANNQRLTLQEFVRHVQRTPPEALRRLPLPDVEISPNPDPSTPKHDRALWERELARAESYWQPARAQDLSLALAGLGTYLGVEELDAYGAVQEICERVGDADVAERLGAVAGTYRKWRGGQRVAFRVFYDRAGLIPPPVKGVHRDLLRMLDDLVIQIPDQDWNPRTRTNDQAVYRKLIELARRHGRHSGDGIEIRISERDLAVQAGMTRKTTQNAIKRLKKLKLAERADQGSGIGAGSYRITASEKKRTRLPQSSYSQVLRDDWDSFVHVARSGADRLGKAAVEALVVLARSSGSMNAKQWAAALRIDTSQLRRRRVKLQESGLVVTAENKHRYVSVPGWQGSLLRILEEEGSLEARERDRDNYEHERRVFRELRHRSSAPEPKP